MTDDIVDRLYKLHDELADDPDTISDIYTAIIEIENLRHKLEVATVDIVVRLRNETDDFRAFELVLEAADEIERLRNELAGSKHQCQMADNAIQNLQPRLLPGLKRVKGIQE